MADVFLKDLITIKPVIRNVDFVEKLSESFDRPDQSIDDYVVTKQLEGAFDAALGLIRDAAVSRTSQAVYLHGSFGSGKTHFMKVLAGILEGNKKARDKPSLQPVISSHDAWIGQRRFLLVPYHLLGAESLDAAILGGYAKLIADRFPKAKPPAVYRDESLLKDAAALRRNIGDEIFITNLAVVALAKTEPVPDSTSSEAWKSWGAAATGTAADAWTTASLDAAFAAHPGDPLRTRLVEDLLQTHFTSFAAGMRGSANAYLPLETGLAAMSSHAQSMGFDAIILFLDELVLWLYSHIANPEFVQTEALKITKLVESADAHRPVPIVSFIARQRALTDLIGRSSAGDQVEALENSLKYQSGRTDRVIALEDRNLPQIAQERVLKPKDDAARAVIDAAFANLPKGGGAWDVLLDSDGTTRADAQAFRDLYPFSPAFLNTLVSLSSALQRERTGLKVLLELLSQRRDELTVGQLIPLGDLWDVLADNEVNAFSRQLQREFDDARRFHLERVRPYLLKKYPDVTEENIDSLPHTHDFRTADRLVKTLLLAYLAPEASALKQLTAGKLAALNQGAIKAMVRGQETKKVTAILKDLAAQFGELRYDESENPVYRLQITGVDVGALLTAVEGKADSDGERRRYVKEWLLGELGLRDTGEILLARDHTWRGTRRRVGVVVGNVRNSQDLADDLFEPGPGEDVRIVFDYPFDEEGHSPIEDVQRVRRLRERGKDGPVVCWLPSFVSDEVRLNLKTILGMKYLTAGRDRIEKNTPTWNSNDREAAYNHLHNQLGNLESQIKEIFRQAYGIARGSADVLSASPEEGHLHCLDSAFRANPTPGVPLARAFGDLADGLLTHLYPKHPDFDPEGKAPALTGPQLKTVLDWVTKASDMPDGRVEVDKTDRPIMRRIANPLKLGEMLDGPFILGRHWLDLIDQRAAQAGKADGADLDTHDVVAWLRDGDLHGAEKQVLGLVVATYALASNRSWMLNGAPAPMPPLDKVDGFTLKLAPLPSEAEYAAARKRASVVFGINSSEARTARTVTALANAVRDRAQAYDDSAAALVRALEQNADVLGLLDSSPRLATARYASELLRTLVTTEAATLLLQRFAASDDTVTDSTLARSLSSAGAVYDALGRANWNILGRLDALAEGSGAYAVQAGRLLERLRDAAALDEFSGPLAIMLDSVDSQATRLMTEAATGPTKQPSAEEKPPAQPTPDDVQLPLPRPASGPATPRTHRGPVQQRSIAATELDEFVKELRASLSAGAHLELSWQVVTETAEAAVEEP